MICPAAFAGGSWKSPHWTREPASPTSDGSIPISLLEAVSSGFFYAPMIAFSEG